MGVAKATDHDALFVPACRTATSFSLKLHGPGRRGWLLAPSWCFINSPQQVALELMTDPYSILTSGTARVCPSDVDVAVRHAESLSACLDIDPTL